MTLVTPKVVTFATCKTKSLTLGWICPSQKRLTIMEFQFGSIRANLNDRVSLRERINDRISSIAPELRAEVGELRDLIASRVDNPPSINREEIRAELQRILADGVTAEDLLSIGAQFSAALVEAGVTQAEKEAIVDQLQVVAGLTERQPRVSDEVQMQFEEAIADGVVSPVEKTALAVTISNNINDRLANLPDQLTGLGSGSFLVQRFNDRLVNVNPELVTELQELRGLIENSVDNPPQFNPDRRTELRSILEGGITNAERALLAKQFADSLTNAGVTVEERTAIAGQIQTIVDLLPSNPFVGFSNPESNGLGSFTI